MIHEDERRILEDWPEAKIITAKRNCLLGNHFHKVKVEMFVLTSGIGRIVRNGVSEKMVIGKLYKVTPGTLHSFYLSPGSVMVGLCSHVFDPTDDYK